MDSAKEKNDNKVVERKKKKKEEREGREEAEDKQPDGLREKRKM